MDFPLSFWEISLWLAFNAIILLIASEFLQGPHPGAHVFVDQRRLRLVALSLGIAFMATVVLHTLQ